MQVLEESQLNLPSQKLRKELIQPQARKVKDRLVTHRGIAVKAIRVASRIAKVLPIVIPERAQLIIVAQHPTTIQKPRHQPIMKKKAEILKYQIVQTQSKALPSQTSVLL